VEHARKLDVTRQDYVKQKIVLVEEQFDIPNKRSIKKFFMRVSCFFMFAIPICLLLQSHFESQQLLYSSKMNQLQKASVELKDTKSAIEDSNHLINQLSDDEFIIEMARKNLFFSKEGEIIFPNIK